MRFISSVEEVGARVEVEGWGVGGLEAVVVHDYPFILLSGFETD